MALPENPFLNYTGLRPKNFFDSGAERDKNAIKASLTLSPYRIGVDPLPAYKNFLLQGAEEDVQEKVQVIETFGPAFLIFTGGWKARIFNYNLLFMNTADNPGRDEFLYKWDSEYRGARALATGYYVDLFYEQVHRLGQLVRAKVQTSSTNQHTVILQLSMFMTKSFGPAPVFP